MKPKAKRHIVNPNGLGGPCCRRCGMAWPCDASILIQELAAISKRLDRIASVNEFLAAWATRQPEVQGCVRSFEDIANDPEYADAPQEEEA